ncbi:MAG TPA: bifunctional UDP-N-acetylglucosamine diphosphorylase/glucosamine-1-phosphate N-acetyltransferase GlmU, partial [Gammaproteobacteria bacterium]|nr:bifunctional UDP-N-acetylglucosamine diphosphorylase/glucosamine-1-phosphate N-acetyltransferase GlmU [Gammaproteobacteria bacterium]
YLTAASLKARGISIVYGHGGEEVPKRLSHFGADWVFQAEQLGTGHAVKQAMPGILDPDLVLILCGDVPLITGATLSALVKTATHSGFSLLTALLDNPYGYGRILRDGQDRVVRIVEEKDASAVEREVREINTGMMCVQAALLRRWLDQLKCNNAQGEYYLTDIVAMAVADGVTISTATAAQPIEVQGVNTRAHLAELERHYQQREARILMDRGVTFPDPSRFDLRGELETGTDVVIDVNVVIEGRVRLGSDVTIGPNCLIRDCEIGDGVEILANCVIEDAAIGKRCRIGPFSRIRPGTRLAEEVHIGNFVEIKNSSIANASKVNHLSYVGDSEVGRNVNIGAGTITCNYDGANKHKTIIEDDVHVGSDTQLVAPVRIGRGVTIGAGATITRDVEPEVLIHNRMERRIVKGWKRPVKEKKGKQ